MLPVVLLMALGGAVPGQDAKAEPVRITVKLPAAARLYVDDVWCTLPSAVRSFETPPLPAGVPYYYTLRAEVVRDGRTLTATREVYVRAGATTTVDFGDLKPQRVDPDPRPPDVGKPAAGGEKPAPPTKGGEFEASEAEKTVLELTNREREKARLKPLRPSEQLFRAARVHAANMARQERLAHDLDGKGPGQRLSQAGYRHAGWGENCAAGQRSAAEAVAGWMASPGHRANLLGKDFAEVGIGVAEGAGGTRYYVQVFATPVGE